MAKECNKESIPGSLLELGAVEAVVDEGCCRALFRFEHLIETRILVIHHRDLFPDLSIPSGARRHQGPLYTDRPFCYLFNF